MENVKIAKVCGLCAGCKRAINCAKAELEKGNTVTIFKEIVHNDNVNNLLTRLGARFVENIEELNSESINIIRAHGEPPETYEYLKKNNMQYKDCTCPNVIKIHKKVQEYSYNGYKVIILGKYHGTVHPEVAGTKGWVNGEAILIENEDDLSKLANVKYERVYVVCQTTFNIEKANRLIDKIEMIMDENSCELVINKSMCNAQRQINLHSVELARLVDVMIVVGGKKSSNSRELYKNVSSVCPTVFIDNVHNYLTAIEELGIELDDKIKIGITAGASTMTEELEFLKTLILRDINHKNEYKKPSDV